MESTVCRSAGVRAFLLALNFSNGPCTFWQSAERKYESRVLSNCICQSRSASDHKGRFGAMNPPTANTRSLFWSELSSRQQPSTTNAPPFSQTQIATIDESFKNLHTLYPWPIVTPERSLHTSVARV